MNEHEPSSLEARAQRLVQSLEAPPAEAAFQARLRERFVSGQIADEASMRAARAPAARASWWRGPSVRWGLAAAATLVVVFAGGAALNRSPGWRLLEVQGVGLATVDGRPVLLGNASQLAAMIRPGSRVRVPDGGSIAIASKGLMAIELTGGSDTVVPGLPGRWFGRSIYAEVQRGTMRITTGSAFKGARLHVETPTADVEVTGTTLAVICEPAGTCVCVLEGRVQVGPQGGEMVDVEAGRRRFQFLDGTEENAPMREGEVMKLTMLRDTRREALER